jgi:methylase of polypeptide subunit release factors
VGLVGNPPYLPDPPHRPLSSCFYCIR